MNTMTWTTPADALGLGRAAVRELPRYAACGPVAVATSPMTGGTPVAGTPAPIGGTALSSARLRGLLAAAGTTGSYTTGVAFPKAIEQLNSTVPGEQPPRDPLGD